MSRDLGQNVPLIKPRVESSGRVNQEVLQSFGSHDTRRYRVHECEWNKQRIGKAKSIRPLLAHPLQDSRTSFIGELNQVAIEGCDLDIGTIKYGGQRLRDGGWVEVPKRVGVLGGHYGTGQQYMTIERIRMSTVRCPRVLFSNGLLGLGDSLVQRFVDIPILNVR